MFESHSEAVSATWCDEDATGRPRLEELSERSLRRRRELAGIGPDSAPVSLEIVARECGVDFVDAVPQQITQDVVELVPRHVAQIFGVMPWRMALDGLEVLAIDPFDLQLGTDLTFALGRKVRLVAGEPAEVCRLIERHYGGGDGMKEIEDQDAGTPGLSVESESISAHDLEILAGQAPVVAFVNHVLGQAIRDRASDIHFEPFESEFKVRYRVDGALRELPPPSRTLALAIASRLKVLGNLNIAERRAPQDGRMRITLDDRVVDLRISTLPTQFGESVVLRVLDRAVVKFDLDALGLPEVVRQGLQEIVQRPHGIFLVTGPTGSGKTTTLYSALRLLNTPERKLLSIEDPVEYETEGMMQVSTNPPAGLTFATALRAFLRQDPDVIMVGEIRDLETARIAVQASLTGHLVMSTLHTNDAPGAITRLLDMGVEPFLLAASVDAVLAQRLVRRICPECRERIVPSAAVLAELSRAADMPGDGRFFHGRGCAACNGTGYQGRLGLFEWLTVTEPLRELMVSRAPACCLRDFVRERGSRSLRDEGLQAVFAGQTTVDEVLFHT